jgi:uncharacterized protein YjbJ (UPF0337 family)
MDEELKGKIKERAGWVTDDRELEREGKREQDEGEAKEKVEDAGDAVERGVDQVSDSEGTGE